MLLRLVVSRAIAVSDAALKMPGAAGAAWS